MSLFQVTKKQVIENYELRTMTGDVVSFTPSYSQLLPDPFSDLNVTVNVEATGGNGTPDNPIPIVGYTEANITRCGVNLFDKSTATQNEYINARGTVITSSGKCHSVLIPIKPNTSYYMSGFGGSGFYAILAVDADGNTIQNWYGGASKTAPFVATTPNNAKYCYLNFNLDQLDTVIFTESSEAVPFTPYNGQTYTIAFGQTVYGGVLDVTRGKLHVNYEYLSDLGSLNWQTDGLGYCQVNLSGIKTNPVTTTKSNILCDHLATDTQANVYGKVNDNTISGATTETVRVYMSSLSGMTTAQVKTALTGYKFAYELATPFDIDLTPEVISAVVGVNNVFADCGETTVTCLI